MQVLSVVKVTIRAVCFQFCKCKRFLSTTMAGSLVKKGIQYVKTKEFRDYLCRLFVFLALLFHLFCLQLKVIFFHRHC